MSAPVREGDILAGKYRVERTLGVGGMGVVVSALHLQLEQRVAIKFLLAHAMESADVVARFSREARAAAKIQSEHVARVLDVGTLESGAPYMVMEYLEGADLAAVLAKRGPLPVPEAIDYVLQACEAIAEAHAAGIVHRDLKPHNLFLTRRADGSQFVKVLDFGISKMAASTNDAAMTKTQALMGSPFYMSPEQLRSSRRVDARTDVWALGIIVHEMLTGRAPFQADTMPALCGAILTEPPPALRSGRPDAPPELEAFLARCLEKDMDRRVASVGELASGLVPFGSQSARTSSERIWRIIQPVSMQATIGSSPSLPSLHGAPAGSSTSTAWAQSQTNAMTSPPRMTMEPPRHATLASQASSSQVLSRGNPSYAVLILGAILVLGVLGFGVALVAIRGHQRSVSVASVPATVTTSAPTSAPPVDVATSSTRIAGAPEGAKLDASAAPSAEPQLQPQPRTTKPARTTGTPDPTKPARPKIDDFDPYH